MDANLEIDSHRNLGTENERILLDGALQFRACQTAFDRSYHANQKLFTRTDGRSDADDRKEAAERAAARAAELEKNVVVTKAGLEYAMSLSPLQLVEAYKDATFARLYRRLIRDHGFKPVPVFGKTGGLR
jgi:hypothetical protein